MTAKLTTDSTTTPRVSTPALAPPAKDTPPPAAPSAKPLLVPDAPFAGVGTVGKEDASKAAAKNETVVWDPSEALPKLAGAVAAKHKELLSECKGGKWKAALTHYGIDEAALELWRTTGVPAAGYAKMLQDFVGGDDGTKKAELAPTLRSLQRFGLVVLETRRSAKVGTPEIENACAKALKQDAEHAGQKLTRINEKYTKAVALDLQHNTRPKRQEAEKRLASLDEKAPLHVRAAAAAEVKQWLKLEASQAKEARRANTTMFVFMGSKGDKAADYATSNAVIAAHTGADKVEALSASDKADPSKAPPELKESVDWIAKARKADPSWATKPALKEQERALETTKGAYGKMHAAVVKAKEDLGDKAAAPSDADVAFAGGAARASLYLDGTYTVHKTLLDADLKASKISKADYASALRELQTKHRDLSEEIKRPLVNKGKIDAEKERDQAWAKDYEREKAELAERKAKIDQDPEVATAKKECDAIVAEISALEAKGTFPKGVAEKKAELAKKQADLAALKDKKTAPLDPTTANDTDIADLSKTALAPSANPHLEALRKKKRLAVEKASADKARYDEIRAGGPALSAAKTFARVDGKAMVEAYHEVYGLAPAGTEDTTLWAYKEIKGRGLAAHKDVVSTYPDSKSGEVLKEADDVSYAAALKSDEAAELTWAKTKGETAGYKGTPAASETPPKEYKGFPVSFWQKSASEHAARKAESEARDTLAMGVDSTMLALRDRNKALMAKFKALPDADKIAIADKTAIPADKTTIAERVSFAVIAGAAADAANTDGKPRLVDAQLDALVFARKSIGELPKERRDDAMAKLGEKVVIGFSSFFASTGMMSGSSRELSSYYAELRGILDDPANKTLKEEFDKTYGPILAGDASDKKEAGAFLDAFNAEVDKAAAYAASEAGYVSDKHYDAIKAGGGLLVGGVFGHIGKLTSGTSDKEKIAGLITAAATRAKADASLAIAVLGAMPAKERFVFIALMRGKHDSDATYGDSCAAFFAAHKKPDGSAYSKTEVETIGRATAMVFGSHTTLAASAFKHGGKLSLGGAAAKSKADAEKVMPTAPLSVSTPLDEVKAALAHTEAYLAQPYIRFASTAVDNLAIGLATGGLAALGSVARGSMSGMRAYKWVASGTSGAMRLVSMPLTRLRGGLASLETSLEFSGKLGRLALAVVRPVRGYVHFEAMGAVPHLAHKASSALFGETSSMTWLTDVAGQLWMMGSGGPAKGGTIVEFAGFSMFESAGDEYLKSRYDLTTVDGKAAYESAKEKFGWAVKLAQIGLGQLRMGAGGKTAATHEGHMLEVHLRERGIKLPEGFAKAAAEAGAAHHKALAHNHGKLPAEAYAGHAAKMTEALGPKASPEAKRALLDYVEASHTPAALHAAHLEEIDWSKAPKDLEKRIAHAAEFLVKSGAAKDLAAAKSLVAPHLAHALAEQAHMLASGTAFASELHTRLESFGLSAKQQEAFAERITISKAQSMLAAAGKSGAAELQAALVQLGMPEARAKTLAVEAMANADAGLLMGAAASELHGASEESLKKAAELVLESWRELHATPPIDGAKMEAAAATLEAKLKAVGTPNASAIALRMRAQFARQQALSDVAAQKLTGEAAANAVLAHPSVVALPPSARAELFREMVLRVAEPALAKAKGNTRFEATSVEQAALALGASETEAASLSTLFVRAKTNKLAAAIVEESGVEVTRATHVLLASAVSKIELGDGSVKTTAKELASVVAELTALGGPNALAPLARAKLTHALLEAYAQRVANEARGDAKVKPLQRYERAVAETNEHLPESLRRSVPEAIKERAKEHEDLLVYEAMSAAARGEPWPPHELSKRLLIFGVTDAEALSKAEQRLSKVLADEAMFTERPAAAAWPHETTESTAYEAYAKRYGSIFKDPVELREAFETVGGAPQDALFASLRFPRVHPGSLLVPDMQHLPAGANAHLVHLDIFPLAGINKVASTSGSDAVIQGFYGPVFATYRTHIEAAGGQVRFYRGPAGKMEILVIFPKELPSAKSKTALEAAAAKTLEISEKFIEEGKAGGVALRKVPNPEDKTYVGGTKIVLTTSEVGESRSHDLVDAGRAANKKLLPTVVKAEPKGIDKASDLPPVTFHWEATGIEGASHGSVAGGPILAVTKRQAKVREMLAKKGITGAKADAAIAEMFPPSTTAKGAALVATIDPVSGCYGSEHLAPTLMAAAKWADAHGGRAFYGESDIGNLGGLNESMVALTGDKPAGHKLADGVFRHLTNLYITEVAAAVREHGGEVHFFRKGGDEFGAVIVLPKEASPTAKQAIQLAMLRAQKNVAAFVETAEVTHAGKTIKLRNIEHLKHIGKEEKAGSGVTFGLAEVAPPPLGIAAGHPSYDAAIEVSIKDAQAHADTKVETKKGSTGVLGAHLRIAAGAKIAEGKRAAVARELLEIDLEGAKSSHGSWVSVLAFRQTQRAKKIDVLTKAGATSAEAEAALRPIALKPFAKIKGPSEAYVPPSDALRTIEKLPPELQAAALGMCERVEGFANVLAIQGHVAGELCIRVGEAAAASLIENTFSWSSLSRCYESAPAATIALVLKDPSLVSDRLSAAYGVSPELILKQAGADAFVVISDVAMAMAEPLRKMLALHHQKAATELGKARGDPEVRGKVLTRLLAEAAGPPDSLAKLVAAEASKVDSVAPDGHVVELGPVPTPLAPLSAEELGAAGIGAGLKAPLRDVLAEPENHTEDAQRLLGYLRAKLPPEQHAAFDSAMKGRLMVSRGAIDKAEAKGVIEPHLLYGKASYDAWSKAHDKMRDAADSKKPLTVEELCAWHAEAGKGVDDGASIVNPGALRKEGTPNNSPGTQPITVPEEMAELYIKNPELEVMKLGHSKGEMTLYVTFLSSTKVPAATESLVHEINLRLARGDNAFEVAAYAQIRFNSIHPFNDGNGRTSKLLAEYVLRRAGMPPAVISTSTHLIIATKDTWAPALRHGAKVYLESAIAKYRSLGGKLGGDAGPTSTAPPSNPPSPPASGAPPGNAKAAVDAIPAPKLEHHASLTSKDAARSAEICEALVLMVKYRVLTKDDAIAYLRARSSSGHALSEKAAEAEAPFLIRNVERAARLIRARDVTKITVETMPATLESALADHPAVDLTSKARAELVDLLCDRAMHKVSADGHFATSGSAESIAALLGKHGIEQSVALQLAHALMARIAMQRGSYGEATARDHLDNKAAMNPHLVAVYDAFANKEASADFMGKLNAEIATEKLRIKASGKAPASEHALAMKATLVVVLRRLEAAGAKINDKEWGLDRFKIVDSPLGDEAFFQMLSQGQIFIDLALEGHVHGSLPHVLQIMRMAEIMKANGKTLDSSDIAYFASASTEWRVLFDQAGAGDFRSPSVVSAMLSVTLPTEGATASADKRAAAKKQQDAFWKKRFDHWDVPPAARDTLRKRWTTIVETHRRSDPTGVNELQQVALRFRKTGEDGAGWRTTAIAALTQASARLAALIPSPAGAVEAAKDCSQLASRLTDAATSGKITPEQLAATLNEITKRTGAIAKAQLNAEIATAVTTAGGHPLR